MGVKDILKSRLPPSALQFLRKIHRMSNMRIVNKNDIFSLPERIHLKKLFNYLRVDCVFDVGANAGQYAQMLRHNVGYHGLIISFEPIPYLADKLRAQAAKDPLWCVEEVALGEANGSFVFNIMESDRFSSFAEPIVTDTQIFSEINRVREKMLVRQETLTSAYGRVSAEQGLGGRF